MLNRVTLIGNIGRQPELRTSQSGLKVLRFSLATTDSFKDKNTGERKKVTEWHNVIKFNVTDKQSEYWSKGILVCVEGKLKTSSYDKNGITVYTTNIIADNIIVLDKKEGRAALEISTKIKDEDFIDDDIPF